MQAPGPIAADIVLLGAGATHLEVLRRFALRPQPGLRLTLVAPEPDTPYAGQLPALISGDCTASDACIDLVPLAVAAGARLILAEATGLDLDARRLELAGRPPLPFDLLSADLCGGSAMPDPPDACIPVSPPGRFIAAAPLAGGRSAGWCAPRHHRRRRPAGTSQLALALARRFRGRLRLVLVSESAEPLAAAPHLARRVARTALVDAGVELASAVRAGALTDGRLALSDGSFLTADARAVGRRRRGAGLARRVRPGLRCGRPRAGECGAAQP